MNRRRYLELVGASVAGLAGCLGGDAASDDASTAPQPSPTATPAPQPSPDASTAGSPTGTPSATPIPVPDVETPAPGECEAPPRPDPETYEGLPEPRSYPDPPGDIAPGPVEEFLAEYESAHLYNRRLADLVEDGACVEYLDTSVTDTRVRPVEQGVAGLVLTTGSYTGATCPGTAGTDTATPPPHGDFFTQPARYLVTERFLVREDAVVECW